MRRNLKLIATILVGIAIVSAIAALWLRPTTLRVAVGPVGSPDMRVVVSYLQALQRERSDIRLRLILAESPADAARLLEARKADLAVVRSDIQIPAKASTVAIMRREAVYLLARPGSGITQISDLRDRRIGLVRSSVANENILSRVLSHYDVPGSSVTRVTGSAQEMQGAVQEGRIDALFFVAPLTERIARAAIQSFPKPGGAHPTLLAVTEAEALLADNPAYDTVEIVRGTFGANPALPDSTVNTLAVTHRLVAQNDLSEAVIAELTRLLVILRPQVARETPMANQLDLPSTEDRAARLPSHPGAVAYIDGETKTFFERYGDYIYLSVMGFSLVGSAFAALFSAFSRRPDAPPPDVLMGELVAAMECVRLAESREDLDRAETETEEIIANLLRSAAMRGGDNAQFAAVALLVSEFRHSVQRKRHLLADGSGAAPQVIPVSRTV